MGSAASYHLAGRGCTVLGLDRHTPPHAFGSSHGQTRIIREAYFEHPSYVPLVQRAYELWAELERKTGRLLFTRTGGLMIGPREGVIFQGAQRSAEQHGLAHQILTSAEVRERFPVLHPDKSMAAVWEPRAGVLFPEACIQAHLTLARQAGATLHLDEAVERWEAEGSGVRVTTARGSYAARQLLCSAGAWTQSVLADLDLRLEVERQVLYWFEPRAQAELFQPEHCPVFLWETEASQFFYGFPNLGEGVKVAGHHGGQMTRPDSLDRAVHDSEVDQMRALVDRYLPAGNGPLRSAVVCMYTNTPDGHFLVDRHPALPQVLIASPCSGHGFKFASAVGEVLADLLLTGRSSFDLGLFKLERRLR